MIRIVETEQADQSAGDLDYELKLSIENVTRDTLYVFGRGGTIVTIPPKQYSDKKRQGVYFTRTLRSKSFIDLDSDSEFSPREPIDQQTPDYGKKVKTYYAHDFYRPMQINGNMSGLLYISKLDIAISFRDYGDGYEHPFSENGVITRALSERDDIISKSSTSTGFLLVNSEESHIGSRYINIAGQVFEIKSIKDKNLKPGLHVTWSGLAQLSGNTETSYKQHYNLDEIDKPDCPFKLYKTFEDATDEVRAAINEREALEAKAKFEKEKLERELTSIERKDNYEQSSVERKENFEERSTARKDYYEERNADRKDSADAFKWILGIAGVTFAMMKTSTKFAAMGSNPVLGVALGATLIGASPPTIVTQAVSATASVLATVGSSIVSSVSRVGRAIVNFFRW